MSLKDCCLAEVSKDCERMCSARNLEDALSSALENCKLEMYKLQWCYMTQRSEHIKIEPAEESVLAASVDEKRIECCSKDSVPSECLGIFLTQRRQAVAILQQGPLNLMLIKGCCIIIERLE